MAISDPAEYIGRNREFTNFKTKNIIVSVAWSILSRAGRFPGDREEYTIFGHPRNKEDIQWVLRTSRLCAAIVARNLLSVLRSRNFFSRKVTPMNRSVAFPAASPGKRKKAVVPEVQCRSIPLFVLSAARKPRFPLNPDRAGRFIAALATAR
jgi:hypothetical protein